MKIRIKNRKALFNFLLLDKYVAGIQLVGSEIKSIKSGKASFADAYCYFKNNELWLKNLHISHYSYANKQNHSENRERKLLLNRKELNKLHRKKKEGGLTIVPTSLFVNERGLAKVEIALAKGKKLYDKREAIKKKDLQRELERKNKF